MALDYVNYKPFSGVGIVSLYKRDTVTGLPSSGGFDFGETSKLDLTNNSPKLEMNTSRSADRGVAFSMAQSKTGSLALEVKTLSDPMFALLTGGSWTEAAASSAVVGWTAPASLLVGQIIKLPHQNVSSVAVKDSAGSPATLNPADYEVDLVGGTIKLKNLGSYTQPLKVDYTPGAVKILGALKAADEDFILHFNGTNAQDGSRAILEVYRFRLAPEGAIGLINTEYGTYQINGSIQKDETKSASSAGGQYYKLVFPGT